MEDVSSRTVGFSARILPEPQHAPSHDLPTASLHLKPNITVSITMKPTKNTCPSETQPAMSRSVQCHNLQCQGQYNAITYRQYLPI